MTRPDGTTDVVRGADGRPLRYFWNRGQALHGSREDYRRERERILGPTQPGSGLFNNPFPRR
jgi:hypothetical protein